MIDTNANASWALTYEAADLAPPDTSADFARIQFVRWGTSGVRRLMEIPGVYSCGFNQSGGNDRFVGRYLPSGGSLTNLNAATIGTTFAAGEIILCAVRRKGTTFQIYYQSQNHPTRITASATVATLAAFSAAGWGEGRVPVSLGGENIAAFDGQLEAAVYLSGSIDDDAAFQAKLDTVWAAGTPQAIIETFRVTSGGNETVIDTVIGVGPLTLLLDDAAGGIGANLAGGATPNFPCFARNVGGSRAGANDSYTARSPKCTITGTLTWRDPFGSPYDAGFFTAATRATGISGYVTSRAHSIDRLRRLGLGTPLSDNEIVGIDRSRVARTNQSQGSAGILSDENYMVGLLLADYARAKGRTLPPFITASVRWPFDCAANLFVKSGCSIVATSDNMTRLATAGASASSVGNGRPMRMTTSSDFIARVKQWTGSLILDASPLRVGAVALKYPGSCPLRVTANTGTAQGAGDNPGSDGAPTDYVLDTTVATGTVSAWDGTTLTLNTDISASISEGMYLTHAGSGTSRINRISDVLGTGSATLLNFEKAWDTAPSVGATVYVGPVSLQRMSVDYSGGEAAWRGIRVRGQSGTPGFNAVLVQIEARSLAATPGNIVAASGCSGKTATEVLASNFGGVNAMYYTLWNSNVGFVTYPGTDSILSTNALAAELTGAVPGARIVYAGDPVHGREQDATDKDEAQWHEEVLAGHQALGYAYVSAFDRGSWLQGVARGERSDGDHHGNIGNERIAARWLELLASSYVALSGDSDSGGAARRHRMVAMGLV